MGEEGWGEELQEVGRPVLPPIGVGSDQGWGQLGRGAEGGLPSGLTPKSDRFADCNGHHSYQSFWSLYLSVSGVLYINRCSQ